MARALEGQIKEGEGCKIETACSLHTLPRGANLKRRRLNRSLVKTRCTADINTYTRYPMPPHLCRNACRMLRNSYVQDPGVRLWS